MLLREVNMRRILFSLLFIMALTGYSQRASGQDFVTTAMSGLPIQTSRVEYSSPYKLRAIPNYQSLKGKFLGSRLQQLESALEKVGISEADIDDLMIGWKPGDKEMGVYGYAAGHFNKAEVAKRAFTQDLTPTPISGEQAYCLTAGVAETCVIILEDSLGAFGPLSSLTALLEAHAGQAPNLTSDPRFAGLLGDVNGEAPVWGIALGTAVSDWFGAWLSTQNNLKLNWGQVFEKVDSLTYSIDASNKVNMDVKLNCETPTDAATLRQILEGVKVAQQLAWQLQNPGRPSPYTAMKVDAHDAQIDLKITMEYSVLTLASGVAAPQN
jgi:hypothetical protein